MEDSLAHIKFLIKKYKDKKKELERELEETADKLNAINKTFGLLEQEGFVERQTIEKSSELSNKYAKMSKRKAIIDILNSNKEKEWKGKEVTELLKINGIKTKSKSLSRDVYGELYRLNKDGKIIVTKTARGTRGTRYKIKQEEETSK